MPARGTGDVLRKNLNDYLNNPKETLKRVARESGKQKNGEIDWKQSAAREILLNDLEPPKGWLYGLDNLPAEDAYTYYKARYEDIFELVPFKQFQRNYNKAIQKAAKRRARSAQEEGWLKEDRKLHPRKTHNNRGEPVFDMDVEAKKQLTDDIKNKRHKIMEPQELWQSREVYQKYTLHKFRQRIYQYEKLSKFVNWLEKERNEKRNEFAAKMEPQEVNFARVPKVAKARGPEIRAGKGPSKRSRSSVPESAKRGRP